MLTGAASSGKERCTGAAASGPLDQQPWTWIGSGWCRQWSTSLQSSVLQRTLLHDGSLLRRAPHEDASAAQRPPRCEGRSQCCTWWWRRQGELQQHGGCVVLAWPQDPHTTAALAHLPAGSTTALLPYLTPVVLRLYLSQPSRCATGMAAELYDLSYDLAGTKALQVGGWGSAAVSKGPEARPRGSLIACWRARGSAAGAQPVTLVLTCDLANSDDTILHGGASVSPQAGQYVLHNSLRSTFSWVADNVPMRVEAVPEQLLADAAWPDVEPGELLNAVKAALTDPGQLGVVAEAVETALGLSADDFAALIPRVAEALETLHRDLPTLQRVAETVHASRWEKDRESDWLSRRPKPREQDDSASSDNSGSSGSHRRAALEGWRARVERAVRRRGLSAQHSMDLGSGISAAEKTAKPMDFQDNQTFGHAGRELSAHEEEAVDEALLASVDDTNGDGTVAAGEEHKLSRRSLLIPSNYDFSYPPSFVAAPPGQMPLVRLPIVFHILLYSDVGGGVGPANYNKAADYVNRMVRIANTMAKPSNFQFFVQVRRTGRLDMPARPTHGSVPSVTQEGDNVCTTAPGPLCAVCMRARQRQRRRVQLCAPAGGRCRGKVTAFPVTRVPCPSAPHCRRCATTRRATPTCCSPPAPPGCPAPTGAQTARAAWPPTTGCRSGWGVRWQLHAGLCGGVKLVGCDQAVPGTLGAMGGSCSRGVFWYMIAAVGRPT